MDEQFGFIMPKQKLGVIRRSFVKWFGQSYAPESGNKSFFDQRGAINISKGSKGISESGGGYTPTDPIALYKPSGGKFVSARKAMDANFGWVYAFVKAISDEMSVIDFRLFRVKKNGEHEEVLEHDLLDILDGVNERQTGPEFKKMLSAHLELTGNAYLYLFGAKSNDGKPKAIYLLNPGDTKVVINKTTYPYQVERYEMYDGDRKFTFEPEEIVHLKYADPDDEFSGKGTVDGIAEWIDNDNYQTEFNRNFFRNGARVSGFFKTDMTSIEQLQRLKYAFEEQFAGVKNAYKHMMMPKGVEFVPAQQTSKDMDFYKGAENTRDKILAGSRVSKTILGTAESDTNRSTAETADYVFAKRTIKPKFTQITAGLNEFLVPRYGDDLYLSFDDPVPEDKAARTDEMFTAVAGKQVITQNEAREQFMGLGPVDDPAADELAQDENNDGPEGGQPGDNGAKKPKKPKEDDEDGKSFKNKRISKSYIKHSRPSVGLRKKIKTQFARNMKHRKEITSELAKFAAEALTKIQKKDVVAMSDDEYLVAIYINSKKLMDEYEPRIRGAMSSVAKRQEVVVLENLESAIKGVNTKKLFDLKEWISITISEIGPIAKDLFSKEFKAAAISAGTPEAQISSHIEEALNERMELLGRSYNETIINTLKIKLDQGLSAGASRAELAESVKEIYAWAQDYQAERIAKTETVAVSNMANKSAWQAGGRVLTVKWFTSQKDNVCPFCQAMAGTEIDINQNFLNLGDTFTGENGETMTANYSDVGGPPLHPNCGCLLRPSSWKPIG